LYATSTRDPTEFYQFVDKIQAPFGVGGDTAEDVMGGLKAALTKLTWRAGGTKVHSRMCHSSINMFTQHL